MFDESERRVPFGRNYCSLMSAFHFLSFSVVLVLSIQDSQVENYSDCVATIAKNFNSLTFLCVHSVTNTNMPRISIWTQSRSTQGRNHLMIEPFSHRLSLCVFVKLSIF